MRPDHLAVRLRTALAGSVVLLLAAATAPAVASDAACRLSASPVGPVELPTLTVAVAADRVNYRHGQTAVVPVEVRVGGPAGPKVSAAQVKVTISAGAVVVKELYGQTDSNGLVRPRWTIGAKVPNGALSAVATASLLVVNSYDCSGGVVYETGRGTADPLATVSR